MGIVAYCNRFIQTGDVGRHCMVRHNILGLIPRTLIFTHAIMPVTENVRTFLLNKGYLKSPILIIKAQAEKCSLYKITTIAQYGWCAHLTK